MSDHVTISIANARRLAEYAREHDRIAQVRREAVKLDAFNQALYESAGEALITWSYVVAGIIDGMGLRNL